MALRTASLASPVHNLKFHCSLAVQTTQHGADVMSGRVGALKAY